MPYTIDGKPFERLCDCCYDREALFQRGPDWLCWHCADIYDGRTERRLGLPKRTMPSDSFLIAQAALNAGKLELIQLGWLDATGDEVIHYLRSRTNGGQWLAPGLESMIRQQLRHVVRQYQ